jgi:hypothetical protein
MPCLNGRGREGHDDGEKGDRNGVKGKKGYDTRGEG